MENRKTNEHKQSDHEFLLQYSTTPAQTNNQRFKILSPLDIL
jgi:hypothetical protein